MSKLNHAIRLAFSAVVVSGIALIPRSAMAQGKGHDKGKEERKAKSEAKHDVKQVVREEHGDVVDARRVTVVPVPRTTVKRVPPGLAKKRVTTPQAVVVTREV